MFWSAEIEHPHPDPNEARRLLDDERRRLNSDKHPDMLAVRLTYARVLAKAGRLDEAVREWEAQLRDALEVVGERHQLTGKIREQLEHWR